MSEIKRIFQIIKDLWSNKRTRSAVILGLYFIFFIFLGIAFRNRETMTVSTNLEKFRDMKSYNYDIESNIDNNITMISGNKNNNIETFILNNKKYLIENTIMYQYINGEKNEIFDYDFYLDISKYSTEYIYNYIKESELILTDKSNDTVVKKYNLSLKKFVNIIDNYLINNDDVITITTYESVSYINKIEIDLTNYIKLDADINNCQLIINYYNINS